MSKKVYTPEVRTAMFRSVVKHLGPWDRAWTSGHPANMTEATLNEKCELVRRDLEAKFGTAAPATARSIAMAIYFTLDLNTAPGERTQPDLRDAAYAAGFLERIDIFLLEIARHDKNAKRM